VDYNDGNGYQLHADHWILPQGNITAGGTMMLLQEQDTIGKCVI